MLDVSKFLFGIISCGRVWGMFIGSRREKGKVKVSKYRQNMPDYKKKKQKTKVESKSRKKKQKVKVESKSRK